jgi:hypothetical protein
LEAGICGRDGELLGYGVVDETAVDDVQESAFRAEFTVPFLKVLAWLTVLCSFAVMGEFTGVASVAASEGIEF